MQMADVLSERTGATRSAVKTVKLSRAQVLQAWRARLDLMLLQSAGSTQLISAQERTELTRKEH
jgi:hypothetical protein